MPTSKQLFSTLDSKGKLQLSIRNIDIPQPAKNQVLVSILAAPINPSDMTPMLAMADIDNAELSSDGLTLSAQTPEALLPKFRSRYNQTLTVGIEGAGKVIAVGEGAEALLGKTVSFVNNAAYAEYACLAMDACIVHDKSTSAKQACASSVNPLSALAMVETMKQEKHSAIIHNAAASNLGQILNRICLADAIPLINIVRKQEQVDLLKNQGAKIVLNSSSNTFADDLYLAISQTQASLVFDAAGGGTLASTILSTMELYFSRDIKGVNSYGSDVLKQAYIYGSLDVNPTELKRDFGMYWSMGGWLLMPVLNRLGAEKVDQLKNRIVKEITTTFSSHFTKELTLKEALMPENIWQYYSKRTGEKFLITPSKNI